MQKNVVYLVLAPATSPSLAPAIRKYFRDLSIVFKVGCVDGVSPFSLNVTPVIVGVHTCILLGLHCASVADTDEVCVTCTCVIEYVRISPFFGSFLILSFPLFLLFLSPSPFLFSSHPFPLFLPSPLLPSPELQPGTPSPTGEEPWRGWHCNSAGFREQLN